MNGEVMPPDEQPLDDDFRAELLALCHETDEGIARIGLLHFRTPLRADAEALVESIEELVESVRPNDPISIADAESIARSI